MANIWQEGSWDCVVCIQNASQDVVNIRKEGSWSCLVHPTRLTSCWYWRSSCCWQRVSCSWLLLAYGVPGPRPLAPCHCLRLTRTSHSRSASATASTAASTTAAMPPSDSPPPPLLWLALPASCNTFGMSSLSLTAQRWDARVGRSWNNNFSASLLRLYRFFLHSLTQQRRDGAVSEWGPACTPGNFSDCGSVSCTNQLEGGMQCKVHLTVTRHHKA